MPEYLSVFQQHQQQQQQQQQEVWIDGVEHQSRLLKHQRGRGYGYMDEQKADMISTWVENQVKSRYSCF